MISPALRFGLLGLTGALAAGLLLLGVQQYVADTRVAEAAAPPAAELSPVAAATAPAKAMEPASQLVVHVAGAVERPGVYRFDKGARVVDAIAAAGGQKPDAMLDALNLAQPLADGERVWVPAKGEQPPTVTASSGSRTPVTGPPAAPAGKLSVNTATANQLDQLPGVTPKTAQAIVEYRTKNGPFRKLDDLIKVTGIGEATLNKLRPLVTL